jgi:hypothetical protein
MIEDRAETVLFFQNTMRALGKKEASRRIHISLESSGLPL